MDSIDNDDIRRISQQLDNFYTAYRSYIYYSQVCNEVTLQKHANDYWKFQKYLLLFSLVVNWCEVFGAHTKNNHWKEITVENQEFNELLYKRGNYNYTSWYSYRKYIEEVKKSYLTNLDVYHHANPDVDLTGMGASLSIIHAWLNNLAKKSKAKIKNEVYDRWPINNLDFDREIEEEFRNLLNKVAT